MTGGADRRIRWTTTGCVGLSALIAGTVSYLHMHLLVELHGQPGLGGGADAPSVDGIIVAASTMGSVVMAVSDRLAGSAAAQLCQCAVARASRRWVIRV